MHVQIFSLHITTSIFFLRHWIAVLICDASHISIETLIFAIVAPRATFLFLTFYSLFIRVILTTSLAFTVWNRIRVC